MIRAGRLTQVIDLERRVEAQAAFNETVWSWEPVLVNEPAGVRAISGREQFSAQQVQASHTHEVYFRYRPGLNLDATMRVVQHLHGDSPDRCYFAIEAWKLDERRTWVTLQCVMREADGWRTDGP